MRTRTPSSSATPTRRPTLLAAAGITDLDDGYVPLAAAGDVDDMLERCVALRFWDREVPLSAS